MTLFNYDKRQAKREELEKKLNAPDFWDDQAAANKVLAELKGIKVMIDPVDDAMTEVEEAQLMLEMAEEAGDEETLAEVDDQATALEKTIDKLDLMAMLSNKYDGRNCYLTIYSREGGTEAQDWTEMLMRMYLYYCEKMGWDITEMDRTYGDEAGLKDVTLYIKGPFAYGYLSAERGTHRLARVSPFNAQGKRQTSFAAVDVIPEFDDTGDFEIDEKDLEITCFARSSGPGGQNVNKVASAVRMVHKPTGVTVVCSNERSQEQNRRQALSILQGKLELMEQEKRDAEQLAESGGKLDMGWGTQIRSYVFYDNRVKDHRTNYEMGNPQRVMDGEIHGFVEAELRRRAKAK
ncbi:MAG: peptide chain release factor 2 [Phycisphaeraceae bacterium]|nr:peptide chain release factor 2 [Phycisphaeraceae bacterium]